MTAAGEVWYEGDRFYPITISRSAAKTPYQIT